jgi:two-component system, OmpR family, sensor histidine kinase BaeS
MIMAVVLALIGTAFIAVRMTQSLRQLSDATKAVASGEFREPLTINTRDEIGALASSFNTMAARLREIDEMKEKFYATVSHELRSPLNAMQEAVRLLESKTSEPLTTRQERLIAIFEKGIERLLRLVNDVLELSRAAAGALPVERRPFAVEDAVKQAISEFGAQAEQQRVTLKAAVEPGVGTMVGDQDRIVQVLVNLIGNALRYTRSGGRVTVSARTSGGEIEFEVADTGIGIPADLIPVIFDRFRQAHSGKGGTGLGLAIVKPLVEAHGGHVSVQSREG